MSASSLHMTDIRSEYSTRPHQPDAHEPTPGQFCIHVYSFGHWYKSIPAFKYPVIKHVECVTLDAPSRELCHRYTGKDRVLSEAFFSNPKNEAVFRSEMASIDEELDRNTPSDRCLTVLVSCQLGMHRSVAMAERIAKELRGRRFKTTIKHVDLEESMRVRRDRREAAKEKTARETAARDEVRRENDRLKRENERVAGKKGSRQYLARHKDDEAMRSYRLAKEGYISQNVARDNSTRRQVAAAPRPPWLAGDEVCCKTVSVTVLGRAGAGDGYSIQVHTTYRVGATIASVT